MDFGAHEKVVGLKQSKKAIKTGQAFCCYIASDADGSIDSLLSQLCLWNEIPTDKSYTKEQLGDFCGIDVDASVVTLLK